MRKDFRKRGGDRYHGSRSRQEPVWQLNTRGKVKPLALFTNKETYSAGATAFDDKG